MGQPERARLIAVGDKRSAQLDEAGVAEGLARRGMPHAALQRTLSGLGAKAGEPHYAGDGEQTGQKKRGHGSAGWGYARGTAAIRADVRSKNNRVAVLF